MGWIARLGRATAGSGKPWFVRVFRTVASEGYHALRRQHGIPLRKRIACWRHGFFADKAVLHDFDKYGYAPYLSDYERHVKLNRINDHGYVLGDKFVAHYVLRGVGAPTPELYDLGGPDAQSAVERLAREHGGVIVKPRDGSGGHGVYRILFDDGRFLVNDREMTSLEDLDLSTDSLVFELVRQHPYASEIFPDSINSIRLMTLWDYKKDEPFFAPFAAHRFGTKRSAPVDNFERGGVFTYVDLETGSLGPAIVAIRDGKLLREDNHPDTGSRIRGTTVPHWEMVKERLKEVARRLHGIRYVGWDIVVTASLISTPP